MQHLGGKIGGQEQEIHNTDKEELWKNWQEMVKFYDNNHISFQMMHLLQLEHT